MNYTTIEINNQVFNLRFGMASFRYLSEKNISILDEIGISHIIYSGYYNWCLVNEVIPSLKLSEIVDFVEEKLQSDATHINNVLKVWGDNQMIKDLAEDPKKKSVGKKSKG